MGGNPVDRMVARRRNSARARLYGRSFLRYLDRMEDCASIERGSALDLGRHRACLRYRRAGNDV